MKFLIVVDMQKDFVSGALGSSEAKAILPNVAGKIKSSAEKGCFVICTYDTHGEDYLSTREGRFLPVEHCIKGTDGWELEADIEKALPAECFRLTKPTFGSVELADIIRQKAGGEPEEIELVGVCTDICVISNAMILKAEFPETEITIDSSCCAGVTPQSHENALNAMRSCQINII